MTYQHCYNLLPDRSWEEASSKLGLLKLNLPKLHLAIIEVSLDLEGFLVLGGGCGKVSLNPGSQLGDGALQGGLVKELARHT